MTTVADAAVRLLRFVLDSWPRVWRLSWLAVLGLVVFAGTEWVRGLH